MARVPQATDTVRMARIQRRHAQAIFDEFGGGAGAIMQRREASPGPPICFLNGHSAIKPFDPWDGRRFDAADWHVIIVAAVEGGDAGFTLPDAEKIMDTIEVSFAVDGARLETARTAAKRFPRPEIFALEQVYYFQEGRLIPPFGLRAGERELRCVMKAEDEVVFDNTIRFLIE
jgi:hypothetical protein